MKINLCSSDEETINLAARYSILSSENFVIQSALQSAKYIEKNRDLTNDIDLFISENKPKLEKDITKFMKKFVTEVTKLVINKYFGVALIMCFALGKSSLNLRDAYTKNSDETYEYLANFCGISSFVAMLIAIYILAINVFRISSHHSNSKKKSRIIRLKEKYRVFSTNKFAQSLSEKYPINRLKYEQNDLKEIVNNIQNYRNIFDNVIVILVVASIITIGYVYGINLDYLINNVPQVVGLGFVPFSAAVLKFILSLDYFNNLIFYKQTLSALQKAQDIAEQTND